MGIGSAKYADAKQKVNRMADGLHGLAVRVASEQSDGGVPITAVTTLKHAALWVASKQLGSQSALAKHLGITASELVRRIEAKALRILQQYQFNLHQFVTLED